MTDDTETKGVLTRATLRDAVYRACPTISREEARELVDATLEEISETLLHGEPVKLRSFGAFMVREKRERIGRNPRSGVEVIISPRRVITFKASPALRARVNGQEAVDDSE